MKEFDKEVSLGLCPLCGKEVFANWVTMVYLAMTDEWVLHHFCHHDGEDKVFTASITLHGKTPEDIFKHWNYRKEV